MSRVMTPSDLIVKTAHGATIQRTEDGQFLVCDCENHCSFTRNLYSAELALGVIESGFSFPYSTASREISS